MLVQCPPAGLKGFTPVGPRLTESVLSPQGYASKELFANFEEIVPLDFGKKGVRRPRALKATPRVGPRPTESVLSLQGYASKELFANLEETGPLDFGKPSGKSRL